MAFPVIASTATTSDASGTATPVTMPAGIVAGNLLVVLVAHGKAALSVPVGGGWEPLVETPFDAGGVSDLSLTIYGKIAVGADTCSLVSTGEETVAVALRITGHGVNDIDTIARDFARATSPSPNPPLCNPDAALVDRLWIEVFGAENGSNAATYQSTGFTQVAQVESPGSKVLLGVAYRNANATSLNPGVMALTAPEDWIAVTMAIPPATLLEATILGTGFSVLGRVTDIPLAATVLGTATEAPSELSTAIQLAAVVAATVAVAADLSTEIPLDSEILAQATVVPFLTTAVPVAAIIEGTVSVGADLTAYLPLFADPIVGEMTVTAILDLVIVPGISQETLSLPGVEDETFTVTN